MNSTLMSGTRLNGTRLNGTVMKPALTTTGATAGAPQRAGAPASVHPFVAASCSAAPAISGIRLHGEIRGAAFGDAPVLGYAPVLGSALALGSAPELGAGVALEAAAAPLSPNADAQLRASVRWSDDL